MVTLDQLEMILTRYPEVRRSSLELIKLFSGNKVSFVIDTTMELKHHI